MSKTHKLFRATIAALSLGVTGPSTPPAARAQTRQSPAARTIEITVEGGYEPSRIEVAPGEPVRLSFLRKEFNPCTREVVFEKLGIRRELPPNQRVVIDLPALSAGEYEFTCGMNMIRGVLVVVGHAH